MRPGTLIEVAERTSVDGDWDHHLREFLDAFYRADGDPGRQSAMIDAEPGLVGDARCDAMLGGTGEHLARRWDLEIPRWIRHPDRYLDLPMFLPDDPSLRPFLLIASPVAFRARLIFTGPDPLQRARFPYRRKAVSFALSWPPDEATMG